MSNVALVLGSQCMISVSLYKNWMICCTTTDCLLSLTFDVYWVKVARFWDCLSIHTKIVPQDYLIGHHCIKRTGHCLKRRGHCIKSRGHCIKRRGHGFWKLSHYFISCVGDNKELPNSLWDWPVGIIQHIASLVSSVCSMVVPLTGWYCVRNPVGLALHLHFTSSSCV